MLSVLQGPNHLWQNEPLDTAYFDTVFVLLEISPAEGILIFCMFAFVLVCGYEVNYVVPQDSTQMICFQYQPCSFWKSIVLTPRNVFTLQQLVGINSTGQRELQRHARGRKLLDKASSGACKLHTDTCLHLREIFICLAHGRLTIISLNWFLHLLCAWNQGIVT